MVSLGMTPRQASDFRGKYEITRERLIERLSWLCARRWSGERVHNDGGWIAKAFSDGYEAPPCYDAFRAAWTKRANELSATRSAS